MTRALICTWSRFDVAVVMDWSSCRKWTAEEDTFLLEVVGSLQEPDDTVPWNQGNCGSCHSVSQLSSS